MNDAKQSAIFIDVINQFFYSMDSFEKHYVKLVKEEVGSMKRIDRDLNNPLNILDLLCLYMVEDSKDEHDKNSELSELINFIETMIKNDSTTKFIYKNLEFAENGISSSHHYVSNLIQQSNSENEIIDNERKQLINSGILNVISSMEILINGLYKHHLKFIYNEFRFDKYTITLAELNELDSDMSPKHYIISDYIDDLFFKKFDKWIEPFFKDCTDETYSDYKNKNKELMKNIKETYGRRNIIVHNNSIVNKAYLTNVDSQFTNGLKYNQKLESSIDYFVDRVNLFLSFGVELINLVFIKSFGSEDTDAINGYNSFGLNLLDSKKFILAKSIFSIIGDMPDNSIKRFGLYNFWLTCKLENNDEIDLETEINLFIEEFKDEFDSQDVLAFSILLDKPDAVDIAINFIKEVAFPHTQINIMEKWPILKLINEDDKYVAFKNTIIYNESVIKGEIDMQDIKSKDANEIKDTIKVNK